MKTVKNDIDAAYSMLVYVLETLSQSFDEFNPTWEDYDPEVRKNLEDIFTDIDREKTDNIKIVLLDSSFLKLQKRFISFITSHLSEEYFTVDAQGIKGALKKSDLNQVLRNTYNIRSKYVHQLIPMLKQLTMPLESETVNWDNQPYLTYNGLFRLTATVIRNFINNQEEVDNEIWNWQDELPGSIEYILAPEYWVHNSDNFVEEMSLSRLEGLISIVSKSSFYGKEQTIPLEQVDELLVKIENLLPRTKKENKLPMFALYTIYNQIIGENKSANYEKTYNKNKDLFSQCSIIGMTYKLLFEDRWSWSLDECVRVFNQYKKRSYKQGALLLPNFVEILILLELSNLYFTNSDYINYEHYLRMAILDLAGLKELQSFLIDKLKKNILVNLDEFIDLNLDLANK